MSLTAIDRETLARLASIMVPGGQGMPPADAIGLAGAPADRVLAISGYLAPPLRRFLDQAGEVADMPALEAAAQADREGFEALSVVVANAYFMDAGVRAAIGYPGQEARDVSGGLTDRDRTLLEKVRARGPIFRDA